MIPNAARRLITDVGGICRHASPDNDGRRLDATPPSIDYVYCRRC